MRKVLMLLGVILVLCSLGYGEPPFIETQVSTGTGIQIEVPKFSHYSVLEPITLHFHTYNSSNFLINNETTDCYLHIYNETNHKLETELGMDSNLIDWEYKFTAGELEKGAYTFMVWCNNSQEAGLISTSFEVRDFATPSVEYSNNFLIVLLLIPLGVGFLLIFFASTLEEKETKREGEETGIDANAPLRWFLRFLGTFMVFPLFIGAQIIINIHPEYSSLAGLFNITAFNWIFWTLIAVFLLYLIAKIFLSFRESKLNELGKL